MLSTHALLYASLIVGRVICWSSYRLPCISDHHVLKTREFFYSKPVFRKKISKQRSKCNIISRYVAQETVDVEPSIQPSRKASVLSSLSEHTSDAMHWATQFGLEDDSGAIFYALFYAIRSSAKLGLQGHPIYIADADIRSTLGNFLSPNNRLAGFFTFEDLTQALEDDFLDANRGIANSKREAWKLTTVSAPRGSSFEDARMNLSDVQAALEKGTVIFNAAGANIPKLASATLACTDATSLPCAVNMYITAAGKRTSAPPHTDRQDVLVVQTQGKKSWKVFSPPDPSLRPNVDMFARGKVDDSLPLQSLEDGSLGSKLLLDVTLGPGDVLFVPAGFPHTTDTINDLEPGKSETMSIHLTFNFETIVWHLDYLNLRRFAIRKAGVEDSALGQMGDKDSPYIGKVNSIPHSTREELFQHIPLGLLDEGRDDLVETTTSELIRISQLADPITFQKVPLNIWKDTVLKVRETGMHLLDIHRDMYLAAMEEGRQRKLEADMISHLPIDARSRAKEWTPERIQRLNVFRVKKFYDAVDEKLAILKSWSSSGDPATGSESRLSQNDWQFTSPLKVGDKVEADLGGAFFPATITKMNGGDRYDVRFFDGDTMNGIERSMIKLLTPPKVESVSTNNMSGFSKKEQKKKKK